MAEDKRLYEILQGMPIPTFVIDQQHFITHWNLACEHALGFAAVEMLGTRRQWEPFYPVERPVMADLIVDNVIESTVEQHYAGKFWRSTLIEGGYEGEDYFPDLGVDGMWLLFTAAPLRDLDGMIIGAIETLQDITVRKRSEDALRESEQRYRELSITDGLTGLYNSRHFFDQIQVEMERAQRYLHPLSLLLLDVDNFKLFNDTYGHLEGDRVLSGLAQVIRDSVRHADTAYRYGGEEFVALLPETDSEEAVRVAERLRASFEKKVFSPSGGEQVSMTISIGVSQLQPGDDARALVRRADAGTYAAKLQGKNCVVFNKGSQ